MYLTNDDDEEEEEGEKDNDDDENILKSASKFNGKKKKDMEAEVILFFLYNQGMQTICFHLDSLLTVSGVKITYLNIHQIINCGVCE